MRVKKYAEKLKHNQSKLAGRDLFAIHTKQNYSVIPLKSEREALKFEFGREGGDVARNRSFNRW